MSALRRLARAWDTPWAAFALVVLLATAGGLVAESTQELSRGRLRWSEVLAIGAFGCLLGVGPAAIGAALCKAVGRGPDAETTLLGTCTGGSLAALVELCGFDHGPPAAWAATLAAGLTLGAFLGVVSGAIRAALRLDARSPSADPGDGVEGDASGRGNEHLRLHPVDWAVAIVGAAATAPPAILLAMLAAGGPRSVVYAIEDLAPLPVGRLQARLMVMCTSFGVCLLLGAGALLASGFRAWRLGARARVTLTAAGFAAGLIGIPAVALLLFG